MHLHHPPFGRRLAGALLFTLSAPASLASQRPLPPKPPAAQPATRKPEPDQRAPATNVTRAAAQVALTPVERAAIQRIVLVENLRSPGAENEKILIDEMTNPSARVRRVAVRALGRLQRPALVADIESALNDADLVVRREGVNAIGQAMQGLRGEGTSASARHAALDDAIGVLVHAAESSRDPELAGIVARTLGRLPYADSAMPRAVEQVILGIGQRPVSRVRGGGVLANADPRAAMGIVHGLYSLSRSRRLTGMPSSNALELLRTATSFGHGAPAGGAPAGGAAGEAAARVRRLAILSLAAAADSASGVVQLAARDPDEQVRRVAMVAQQGVRDMELRRAIVTGGLRDASSLVRVEAIRAWRALPAIADCTALLAALSDRSPHVALAAIDALGGTCSDRERVVDTLQRLIDGSSTATATRTRGNASWHRHARALVALARVAPNAAIPVLRRDALHPVWQVRMHVARAATVARDTITLSSLAYDPSGGVREAALSGLSATIGHAADRDFVAALGSPDYHVVLEAATALRGAPRPDSIVPALFAALERLTTEQRENTRDPRIAILERIEEMGSARYASRLGPWASDFDSTVARRSATLLERWTMRRVAATPKPLIPPSEPVAQVIGGELRLLVRMSPSSGGGSFVVRLLGDDAPVTVARIVRLARAGYYSGLTFHRVEPGFVIQGGSPAATEYVGDGPFMRDELGLVSNTRGTFGISTRGRDTGDAQFFVNLIDNFRLDHDYTVFGDIVQGREVAEGVLEGDVIERVDVLRLR